MLLLPNLTCLLWRTDFVLGRRLSHLQLLCSCSLSWRNVLPLRRHCLQGHSLRNLSQLMAPVRTPFVLHTLTLQLRRCPLWHSSLSRS